MIEGSSNVLFVETEQVGFYDVIGVAVAVRSKAAAGPSSVLHIVYVR